MRLNKSLYHVSFFQSLGLISYIALVAILFWKGNQWIPNMHEYVGPLIVLTIFAVSALVCALITLSYPFILWQKGKMKDAMKVIFYTVMWTIGFIVILLLSQLRLS